MADKCKVGHAVQCSKRNGFCCFECSAILNCNEYSVPNVHEYNYLLCNTTFLEAYVASTSLCSTQTNQKESNRRKEQFKKNVEVRNEQMIPNVNEYNYLSSKITLLDSYVACSCVAKVSPDTLLNIQRQNVDIKLRVEHCRRSIVKRSIECSTDGNAKVSASAGETDSVNTPCKRGRFMEIDQDNLNPSVEKINSTETEFSGIKFPCVKIRRAQDLQAMPTSVLINFIFYSVDNIKQEVKSVATLCHEESLPCNVQQSDLVECLFDNSKILNEYATGFYMYRSGSGKIISFYSDFSAVIQTVLYGRKIKLMFSNDVFVSPRNLKTTSLNVCLSVDAIVYYDAQISIMPDVMTVVITKAWISENIMPKNLVGQPKILQSVTLVNCVGKVTHYFSDFHGILEFYYLNSRLKFSFKRDILESFIHLGSRVQFDGILILLNNVPSFINLFSMWVDTKPGLHATVSSRCSYLSRVSVIETYLLPFYTQTSLNGCYPSHIFPDRPKSEEMVRVANPKSKGEISSQVYYSSAVKDQFQIETSSTNNKVYKETREIPPVKTEEVSADIQANGENTEEDYSVNYCDYIRVKGTIETVADSFGTVVFLMNGLEERASFTKNVVHIDGIPIFDTVLTTFLHENDSVQICVKKVEEYSEDINVRYKVTKVYYHNKYNGIVRSVARHKKKCYVSFKQGPYQRTAIFYKMFAIFNGSRIPEYVYLPNILHKQECVNIYVEFCEEMDSQFLVILMENDSPFKNKLEYPQIMLEKISNSERKGLLLGVTGKVFKYLSDDIGLIKSNISGHSSKVRFSKSVVSFQGESTETSLKNFLPVNKNVYFDVVVHDLHLRKFSVINLWVGDINIQKNHCQNPFEIAIKNTYSRNASNKELLTLIGEIKYISSYEGIIKYTESNITQEIKFQKDVVKFPKDVAERDWKQYLRVGQKVGFNVDSLSEKSTVTFMWVINDCDKTSKNANLEKLDKLGTGYCDGYTDSHLVKESNIVDDPDVTKASQTAENTAHTNANNESKDVVVIENATKLNIQNNMQTNRISFDAGTVQLDQKLLTKSNVFSVGGTVVNYISENRGVFKFKALGISGEVIFDKKVVKLHRSAHIKLFDYLPVGKNISFDAKIRRSYGKIILDIVSVRKCKSTSTSTESPNTAKNVNLKRPSNFVKIKPSSLVYWATVLHVEPHSLSYAILHKEKEYVSYAVNTCFEKASRLPLTHKESLNDYVSEGDRIFVEAVKEVNPDGLIKFTALRMWCTSEKARVGNEAELTEEETNLSDIEYEEEEAEGEEDYEISEYSDEEDISFVESEVTDEIKMIESESKSYKNKVKSPGVERGSEFRKEDVKELYNDTLKENFSSSGNVIAVNHDTVGLNDSTHGHLWFRRNSVFLFGICLTDYSLRKIFFRDQYLYYYLSPDLKQVWIDTGGNSKKALDLFCTQNKLNFLVYEKLILDFEALNLENEINGAKLKSSSPKKNDKKEKKSPSKVSPNLKTSSKSDDKLYVLPRKEKSPLLASLERTFSQKNNIRSDNSSLSGKHDSALFLSAECSPQPDLQESSRSSAWENPSSVLHPHFSYSLKCALTDKLEKYKVDNVPLRADRVVKNIDSNVQSLLNSEWLQSTVCNDSSAVKNLCVEESEPVQNDIPQDPNFIRIKSFMEELRRHLDNSMPPVMRLNTFSDNEHMTTQSCIDQGCQTLSTGSIINFNDVLQ